ncbi:hypothetical protein [Halorubrum sp. DTA46]|uniref:hypothetical protein n=1 Tax=Halorubrum sp. DTA46 TaxID=3402162 RepID=UPI003AAB6B03
MTADRGIATGQADDARAYVGYDSPDEIRIEFSENVSQAGGSDTNETETNETDDDAETTRTVTLVTVTNRFDTSIGVAPIAIDEPDGLDVTVTSTPTEVSPGGSGEIVAELDCEDSFEGELLSVTIAVDGGAVSAEISGDKADRTVSITCDGGS